MSKARKCLVAISCGVVMLVLLYGWFAFTRTPWYVHRYLTPPYEAEAKEFFETNRSTFKYLAQCFEDWSSGEKIFPYYSYAFHLPNDPTDTVPVDVILALQHLEATTKEYYCVSFYQNKVIVGIHSSTNFDVDLCYGDTTSFHVMDYKGWGKETALEDGWTIQAHFWIRN